MECRYKCTRCGREYSLAAPVWRCECGSTLSVECSGFEFEPLAGVRGMWRYRRSLPLLPGAEPVTLGEGGTPLVRARLFGLRVLLKLEYLNPTGSFKDRGSSLAVTNLRAAGVGEVVLDSSGNAGASMSAYAAAAGLKCRVYVPAGAPRGKVAQIRAYGAEVVEVEGGRGEATRRALAELGGAFYASHLWSPFFPEASATIAYEVFEELGTPDAAVVPVGSGGLLIGVFEGFRRLRDHGYAPEVPRVYAVQSAANAPLYAAVYGRQPGFRESEVLADGLAVPEPPRLGEAAECVRSSRGGVVVVSNEGIAQGIRTLARMGLLVEPTSATVVPALHELVERGELSQGDEVLAPLTGFGLKALDKLARVLGSQQH